MSRDSWKTVYPSIIDRFWSKVVRTETCWLWTGCATEKGYGQFEISARDSKDGKRHNAKAHRFIYEYLYGEVDESTLVCHACDVPRCVRPDHLFLGSHQDNVDDMVMKGRERKRTEIPDETIINILNWRYNDPLVGIDEISSFTGVSQSYTAKILRGDLRKNLSRIYD